MKAIRIVIRWTDPDGRPRLVIDRVTDPDAARRISSECLALAQSQRDEAERLESERAALDAWPGAGSAQERARLDGAIARAGTYALAVLALSMRLADARDALLAGDPGAPSHGSTITPLDPFGPQPTTT